MSRRRGGDDSDGEEGGALVSIPVEPGGALSAAPPPDAATYDEETEREILYTLDARQTRARTLLRARVAEEVQDFDRMKRHMVELVQGVDGGGGGGDAGGTRGGGGNVVGGGNRLDEQERRMFLIAFKTCVGARRKAWRTLKAKEAQMETSDPLLPHLRLYRAEVEAELEEACGDLLACTRTLLESASSRRADTYETVFFLKLRGDYWRYLCEIRNGRALDDSRGQARRAYSQAHAVTQGPEGLRPSDPQLLGLALNRSVFHYEILHEHDEGLRLCRDAFEAAEHDLRRLPPSSQSAEDARDVMTLLRDNLELWENDSGTTDGRR
jgi:hypothetical protein